MIVKKSIRRGWTFLLIGGLYIFVDHEPRVSVVTRLVGMMNREKSFRHGRSGLTHDKSG
jgi:hypothetical protein